MKVVLIVGTIALIGLLAHPSAQSSCGMQMGTTAPAFCDTFDQPSAINSRGGQLNSVIWGVSRLAASNFGQQQFNIWAATQLQRCNGALLPRVVPPNDVIICNGQLREASNDNVSGAFEDGTVTVLAMYPKQPFDFAGRTGTVSFDVSNDTHGIHGAWPELWVTDKPVPAPFTHLGGNLSLPQHGFGIRFAAGAGPGTFGNCPSFPNTKRWTVDSAVVIRNYVMEDRGVLGLFGTASSPPLTVTLLDCVVSPPDNSGVMNHVEVRVSQNQIDVYATDAGTLTPLKRIAVITNANLSFTSGLIWLEDVHYNADKADPPSQREHTFVWDNVAFDGPFTYRDLSYDALDALTPGPNGSVNLGKPSGANQTASWSVPGLPANPVAASVRVLFNFFHYTAPTTLTVTVNGHPHPTPYPYPETAPLTWRTMAVTIPISDLVAGTNTVLLGGNQDLATSNVNIVLVNTGTVTPPVVTVAIAPTTAGVSTGAGQQFTCTVTGSTNTACTWSVTEGAAGGTVTSAGLYMAPTVTGTFHVRAVSVADTTKSATATVTVMAQMCPPLYPHGQQVAILTNGSTVYSTLCTQ